METKHYSRNNAEKSYKLALAAWNVASAGTDEAAFNAANDALKSTRDLLCAAERDYPTNAEARKLARTQYFASRGMDVFGRA